MRTDDAAATAEAATLAVPMAAMASRKQSAEASGQTEQNDDGLRFLAALHEIRRLGA